MKIAFLGTSDRSIPIIETLSEGFDLKLCITKQDTKVGRNQVGKETMVKTWAKSNNVEYIEIENMKKDEERVIDKIKKTGLELGVMADFGFILPKSVIETFPKGIVNIHFSKLPKYRGASPVQHTILNGDKTTGITYYLSDEGLDTGDILKCYEYNIDSSVNSGDLYTILFEKAAKNVCSVIKNYISGKLPPLPQSHSNTTYTYSRTHPKRTLVYKEDARIDWSASHRDIERMIRAYNPWPIAWTTLGEISNGLNLKLKDNKKEDLHVKIFRSKMMDQKLIIEKIQVEGKNPLSWKEFTNGYLVS